MRAYAEAEVVRVVLDNLNTHQTAFLYGTFPAGEARQIAKRLGFHYPPKHGSWLNPALSLPKGWRRSSQRTVSFLPQAMASRDGIVPRHAPAEAVGVRLHRRPPCRPPAGSGPVELKAAAVGPPSGCRLPLWAERLNPRHRYVYLLFAPTHTSCPAWRPPTTRSRPSGCRFRVFIEVKTPCGQGRCPAFLFRRGRLRRMGDRRRRRWSGRRLRHRGSGWGGCGNWSRCSGDRGHRCRRRRCRGGWGSRHRVPVTCNGYRKYERKQHQG